MGREKNRQPGKRKKAAKCVVCREEFVYVSRLGTASTKKAQNVCRRCGLGKTREDPSSIPRQKNVS